MNKAHSEYRDVSINFEVLVTDTAAPVAPIDFYKAATKKVEEIEFQIAKDSSQVTDLTGATVLLTGALSTKVHKALLTSVKASGTYIFEYDDTFASIEEALA